MVKRHYVEMFWSESICDGGGDAGVDAGVERVQRAGAHTVAHLHRQTIRL